MNLAIVGGGPAGLRAAEVAAAGGATVTLFDAKPSVGRKFLVAGRGGLNLTKAEPVETFARRYSGPDQPPALWPVLLSAFGPEALRGWAAELGIETFAASTGRVYPRELKGAPLLRRWLHRLRGLGVQFALHHRWLGFEGVDGARNLLFQAPEGLRSLPFDACILALGGGSWPETGSDGAWTAILEQAGIAVSMLEPANCGWEIAWPPEVLAKAEGQPLKNIAASAAGEMAAGELLITGYGLEGGAIYQLGSALRGMAAPVLSIDLKPGTSAAQLVARLGPIRRNILAEAGSRWRLSPAAFALLSHCAGAEPPLSPESAAALCKACTLRLLRPRPLAEAISSAGGVRWPEIDGSLMLRRLPGVFVAGEMIDWEAPTGGYLLQGCFASGDRAARSALKWLSARNP